MKNEKNNILSFELLVGETYEISDTHSDNNIKFEYIDDLGLYRLSLAGQIIDFPKSYSVIQELKYQSYLALRDFDNVLNEVFKELMQTTDDIILYYFKDCIFIETQSIEEIKKAA